MTNTAHSKDNTNDTEQTSQSYPESAGITLAAKDGSKRYYFRHPTGGIASIPAMNPSQARDILADRTRGFTPSDFEQVDGFDAEGWEYPTPTESDREVNEHDIWMLQCATYKGSRVGLQGKHYKRKNPTQHTLESLLAEWDDPSDIPLDNIEQLQQADNVGPERAGQVIGAAVADKLIERPSSARIDKCDSTNGSISSDTEAKDP